MSYAKQDTSFVIITYNRVQIMLKIHPLPLNLRPVSHITSLTIMLFPSVLNSSKNELT
jgi:hypothetical protein